MIILYCELVFPFFLFLTALKGNNNCEEGYSVSWNYKLSLCICPQPDLWLAETRGLLNHPAHNFLMIPMRHSNLWEDQPNDVSPQQQQILFDYTKVASSISLAGLSVSAGLLNFQPFVIQPLILTSMIGSATLILSVAITWFSHL